MIYRIASWIFGDGVFDALLADLDRLQAERDDLDEALDRACLKVARLERIAADLDRLAADLRRQLDEERSVRFGVVSGQRMN